MSEQAGRYQRSAAGMIGALVVLALVIGGYVIFRSVTRDDPASPVSAVDYGQTVEYARKTADFDLLAPPSLPAGWKATSVSFTPGAHAHWHLGQLTENDKYVGLEQGDVPAHEMVTSFVDENAVRGGDVDVDGDTWAAWSDSGGDQALVRREGNTTTLVVGTVPQDVLVGYVRSLR